LSRSFQDMSAGLVTFHEAKKIAEAPLPYAYHLFTNVILWCLAFTVPWMMAHYTRGLLSTFASTFVGVFLMWFLNFVADALDNPFKRMSHTLEAPSIQRALNSNLEQLLSHMDATTPYIVSLEVAQKESSLKRQSMFQWRTNSMNREDTPESDEEETGQSEACLPEQKEEEEVANSQCAEGEEFVLQKEELENPDAPSGKEEGGPPPRAGPSNPSSAGASAAARGAPARGSQRGRPVLAGLGHDQPRSAAASGHPAGASSGSILHGHADGRHHHTSSGTAHPELNGHQDRRLRFQDDPGCDTSKVCAGRGDLDPVQDPEGLSSASI